MYCTNYGKVHLILRCYAYSEWNLWESIPNSQVLLHAELIWGFLAYSQTRHLFRYSATYLGVDVWLPAGTPDLRGFSTVALEVAPRDCSLTPRECSLTPRDCSLGPSRMFPHASRRFPRDGPLVLCEGFSTASHFANVPSRQYLCSDARVAERGSKYVGRGRSCT